MLTTIAMVSAMFMVAQHIAGKATRDALFLTYFDVSQLPIVLMVSAAVSLAVVLLTSRLLNRLGPGRLIPPLYLASALLLAVQWYLADTAPRVAVIALYLHVAALNSILISGFWSIINERFDPYTAKKVIPRLAAASAFGGVLGGLVANAVASAADTHAILLVLSGMHLICGVALAVVCKGQRHTVHEDQPVTHLLTPMKRSPLIRRMALLALLVATTAAVLDYILKAEAAATLAEEDLITFFAYFYTVVSVGTFLLQSAAGNRALRWLGLGGTMATWPLAILVTGGAALFIRSLVTVTIMRASANLLYNSLFRAGFEQLYVPIAPADKRSGKVLIDVGADRSGDLLGGLVILLILMIPIATGTILLVTALILAVVCLVLILVLNRGYVIQLADNLRSGKLRAEDLEVVDATTANTVVTTQSAIERDRLLRDIASLADTRPSEYAPIAEARPTAPVDAVTESIMALRSGEVHRIRRILASHAMTAELLPHSIPLLADERVLGEVLKSLRTVASSGAGQLVDAILQPLQHPLVKRRLPLVLAYSDSPLAVEGLTTGLDDPDWNARFRCAHGLEAIHRRQPHLAISEERLLAITEKQARALFNPGGRIPTTSPVDASHREVHFLFLLLGALYEPNTLDLCLRALQSDDRDLQGTALEYLENLLPNHIWVLLQPALAPGHKRSKKLRPLQQIARDLLAAASSLRSKPKLGDTGMDAADALD